MILSGRYDEREKVEALERGADDYVTKPFGVEELNARLRVALRRAAGPGATRRAGWSIGPLVLDASTHEVTRERQAGRSDAARVRDPARAARPQRARSSPRASCCAAVWGEAYRGEDSYVYVHVSQLRRKLAAADPAAHFEDLIVTEPGVGYRIAADLRQPLGRSGPVGAAFPLGARRTLDS